jgi:anti-sigma factor RsiW
VDDLTCAEVVERLTDYLEEALSADDAAALREHLSGCDGCAAYLDELRATMSLVGNPAPTELFDEQTEEDLLDLFRKWVDPDGGTAQ